MRFMYDGTEYEAVKRPLVAETAFFERQAGLGTDEMTSTERTFLALLITLKRAGVVLTWKEATESMSLQDFDEVKEPEVAGPEVPTAAGVEVGAVTIPEPSTSESTATGY